MDMNLLNFSTTYPDEASCKAKWKSMRDKQGIICPHCGEYLQNYLNEFCYKFNRRYFGQWQFERLLVASGAYKNEFRYHIIIKNNCGNPPFSRS
jgi:hypothetical protein